MSGAVGNRTYRGHSSVGVVSNYAYAVRLETAFTGIIALMVGAVSSCAYAMRLETAPTGLEENIELPNYFLKPHTDCVTKEHFYDTTF